MVLSKQKCADVRMCRCADFFICTFAYLFIYTSAFAQVDFSSTQICKGNVTTLNGTSVLNDTIIQSWNWDLDNDGIFDDAQGKTLNYIFAGEGNLTVRLKIILKSGSEDSTSKSVTVFPLPNVIYTAENICEGNQVAFNASANISSGMVVQYKWDFTNDGQTDLNVLDSSLNYYLGQAGNYWVNLQVVSEKGCVSSVYSKEIKVFNLPSAKFDVQGNLRAEEIIQFNNSTFWGNDVPLSCLWSFGDNKTDFGINSVTHEYDTAGVFNIQMIAVSENNCVDTAWKTLNIDTSTRVDTVKTIIDTVLVTPELKKLKNILTPNGDGINDLFLVEEVTKGGNCELKVFNQWNEVVYSSSAYNNDWDGQNLKTGTYFYILDCGGEKTKGSINILK